jgi:glycosyltransferase involved in cell wall biosynthesis
VRALFEAEGIPVVEYDAAEPSYRHPMRYLRASASLARQLRAHQVDLVHFADVLAAHRCSLAAVLAGIPAITQVRNSFPDKVSRRDRTFLAPVRRFVFVSAEAMRSFGMPMRPDRATVLYDGIAPKEPDARARTAVRAELGIPATAPVIGMVARVAPQKDYPTLVRAAADLTRTHPDVRFLIVGQYSGIPQYAEHYAMVRRLMEDLGVSRHFVFTDHRDDVDRMIAATDIGVLSTHQEGLPLVILEAMAQSKPFVATNVGGIPEIVRDHQTGLLVPHGDAPALARALRTVLDDPALAARLGQAGKALVETEFSLASFQTRGRELYRSLVGASSDRQDRAGVDRSS